MTLFQRLGATVMGLLLASQAQAATFELGGDESLNCVMTISGPIVEGDAERFRDFLAVLTDDLAEPDANGDERGIPPKYFADPGDSRICLDSSGGSLSEAIEMADTLVYNYRFADIEEKVSRIYGIPGHHATRMFRALGTAVAPGARCESACAVLFMAGGHFLALAPAKNIRNADRVLHVDGQLGFHAPGLVIPQGNYSTRSVEQAFQVAVKTTSRLSDRLELYRFPPSLFQRMLSTPPNEMFYVETVEQAASWVVDIAGAPRVAKPTLGNLEFLCTNLSAVSAPITDAKGWYSNIAPSDIRENSKKSSILKKRPGLSREKEIYVFEDDSKTSSMFRTTSRLAGAASVKTCAFEVNRNFDRFRFEEFPPRDHGLFPIEGNYAWAMFPGYLTLSDLSDLARRFPSGRVPNDTLLPPVVDTLAGYCVVYGRDRRARTTGRCDATLFSRQHADRTGHEDTLLVSWPDGKRSSYVVPNDAETGYQLSDWTLVSPFLEDRLPVQPPAQELEDARRAPPNAFDGEYGTCFRQARSGETRCFHALGITDTNVSVWRR